MLSLDDLRFFVVVARSPTLAAAARALDVTAPAVTQRLRQMEERLRVRLVDRSTRRLVLTDEGELVVARAVPLLDAAGDLAESLASRRGAVTGHLRVVAPFGFGRRYVAPVVAAFQEAYPETTTSLALSETPQRLPSESWDVAVHVGELRDSLLISQRIAPNGRIACAAPSYLARRGAPAHPDELRGHDCLALRENDEDVTLWRFTTAGGDTATARVTPRMASNDGDVVRAWALQGRGVIIRSEWDVADHVRDGALVRIMPQWEAPPADIRILLGERGSRTARTTRFVALLRESLSPAPWRAA